MKENFKCVYSHAADPLLITDYRLWFLLLWGCDFSTYFIIQLQKNENGSAVIKRC